MGSIGKKARAKQASCEHVAFPAPADSDAASPKPTGRIITHPGYKATLDSLEDFLRNAFDENGQARCALLSGPPRCGKTTLAEHVRAIVEARPLPSRTGDPDMERKRVVYVDTPAAATQKSMAETILLAAGDAVNGRHSQSRQTKRVAALLGDLDVELLILDEFHHLITTGKKAQATEVSEWVKSLLNEGVCPILLVGVDPVSDLVSNHGQLEGRCWCQPTIQAFGWSTPEEQRAFRLLLRHFQEKLPVPATFDLSDWDFAQRMHQATAGAIGVVSLLIEKISSQVRQRGLSAFTLDLVAEAFADWSRLAVRNPFR